jgi:predicted metalloprotease
MRWKRGQRSEHIEDRRGKASGFPGGAKGIGGTAGVVVIIVGLLLGVDVSSLTGGGSSSSNVSSGAGGGSGTQSGPPARDKDPDATLVDFMSFLIDDIQKTFDQKFRATGKRYTFSKLVLYTKGTRSGCGYGDAAIGPFYCPADSKVYLDLSFFRTLKQRLGAPGDFAQAYVLAHEIGHHIQNITGIDRRVHSQKGRDKRRNNELSVRQELQADCFSGVWAHSTKQRKLLDAGDIDEGIRAAWSIGDDTLQKGAGRTVRPEKFTHGSSAQRVKWFKRGFASGNMDDCDTFSVARP